MAEVPGDGEALDRGAAGDRCLMGPGERAAGGDSIQRFERRLELAASVGLALPLRHLDAPLKHFARFRGAALVGQEHPGLIVDGGIVRVVIQKVSKVLECLRGFATPGKLEGNCTRSLSMSGVRPAHVSPVNYGCKAAASRIL